MIESSSPNGQAIMSQPLWERECGARVSRNELTWALSILETAARVV